MEIISYVGGRPDNRQKKLNFNFSTAVKRIKKNFARKRLVAKAVTASKPYSYENKLNFDELKIQLRKFLKFEKKFWWILPFAAVLAFIPVFAVHMYFLLHFSVHIILHFIFHLPIPP